MAEAKGAEGLLKYQVAILEEIRDLCNKTIAAESDNPPDLWEVGMTLLDLAEDFSTTLTDEPSEFEDRDRSGRG